jgi:hypothetical protein
MIVVGPVEIVQFDIVKFPSHDICHPEPSRYSGVAKDLLLNRPNA